MPTESAFLLAGLFLLLVAAGWVLGRFGERDDDIEPPPPLNLDYLKGLNFLLNEQTDQALEHFLKMVRVEDKTIETHFALGSLFRRRGEVDRAIRIHQNIIARPDLAVPQRDQALYSLAKDYLRAGLLDRAEKMFVRLSQGSLYQAEALRQLCRIYEQERDWQKAIDAGHKLESLSGNSLELQIAHYYCELAEQATAAGDFISAKQHLKKAHSGRPRTLRGALTRADIASNTGDRDTAVRLYRRIIDENTYLITEALPKLVALFAGNGADSDLEREIVAIIEHRPELRTDVAYTAIVNNIGGIPIIDKCVEEYMKNDVTLAEFIDLQQFSVAGGGNQKDALIKVRSALSKLAATTPRYQCTECGFSSQRLLWQCPSCKNWETQRPFTSVKFDSLLQRSNSSR
jgi:lipopolysaccharide biosynthesis regulator YciM